MPGGTGTNQVRQLLLSGFGGLLLLLAFTGLNGLVSPRENSKPATPPSAKTTSTMIASSAESAQGISPRAAHRTGLEPLDSSGSCHPLKAAAFHQDQRVP